jgi:hypothetical protein
MCRVEAALYLPLASDSIGSSSVATSAQLVHQWIHCWITDHAAPCDDHPYVFALNSIGHEHDAGEVVAGS